MKKWLKNISAIIGIFSFGIALFFLLLPFGVYIEYQVKFNPKQAWAFVSSKAPIEYVINASEADQGATGNGRTIKVFVDAIGGTRKATIKLLHTSKSTFTNYTLTTSDSITDNIALDIDHGAKLDGAGTLTINGPFGHGLSQCFGSSITVVFGSGSIPYDYPEWWGIDGTADEVEINKAIEAAVNILCVKVQGKTYTIAASVTMATADYMALICDAGLAILTTSADIDGIVFSKRSSLKNIRTICTHGTPTKAGFKLTDGVLTSNFEKFAAIGFKYGLELYSSTATGIAYNSFYHFATTNIVTTDVYIHGSGSGWVNENLFLGGDIHSSATGSAVNITLDGCDQNKFYGVSFEGGDEWLFTVIDHGTDQFIGCRFEAQGYGIYVHNSSGSWGRTTSIAQNLWLCKVPYYAVMDGFAHINNELTFMGGMDAVARVSVTVDADSASGQKVLNVASTANIYVQDTILVNSGGEREEWCFVASIQAGVSLTMQNNLRYTHTGAQADAVVAEGRRWGINYRAWNVLDFYNFGVLVFQIDHTGAAKLKGALSASTDPTP